MKVSSSIHLHRILLSHSRPRSDHPFWPWPGTGRGLRFCLAVVVLITGACGGGTDPESYNGSWSGSTSQGRAFGFTVAGNALTGLNIGYSLSGNCSPSPVGESLTFPVPQAIVGNSFSITGSTAISGTFSSATAASGTFSVDFTGNPPGCSSTATGTWTANK